MLCECGAKTQVIDSRVEARHGVYRRRRCPDCGRRFSTREVEITAAEVLAARQEGAAVARSHRGGPAVAAAESVEGLDARSRLAALFEGRL